MTRDPDLTDDPWEHVRLLSDPARNAALLGFLEAWAPGRRVLEVGCGTGLLAAVAARLGASEVTAVEATALAAVARRLMDENRLPVRVLEGRLQDLPPEPFDLVFSELLNADPFSERVVEVSFAARRWLAPGGRLAPRTLRIWAAATRAEPVESEARHAAAEVRAIGERYGLDVGAVARTLSGAGAFRTLTSDEVPAGRPVVILELSLGELEVPPPITRFRLPVGSARATGVLVWFEAELDERHALHNRPGTENHWGQQVHGFGAPLPDGVELVAEVRDGELFLSIA